MNALIVFLLVLTPVACRTSHAAAQQAPAKQQVQVAPAQHSHVASTASSSGDGYLQLTVNGDKGDLLLVMHGDRFTGILDGEVLPPERLQQEGDKLTVLGADGSVSYEVRVDSKHHSLVYPYDAKENADNWNWADESDPFGVGSGSNFGGATVWRGADRKLIGVTTSAVDSALRAQLGVDGDAFVIESVTPDMPAGKAGMQPFDVVTAIEGQPGASTERLRDVLDEKKAGDKLVLTVLRRGQSQDLELTLEEPKTAFAYSRGNAMQPGAYAVGTGVPYRTLVSSQATSEKQREELLAQLAACQAQTEKLSAAQSGEAAKELAELAQKQSAIADQLRAQSAAAQANGNYLGVLEQQQDGSSRWLMLPNGNGTSVGVGGASSGGSPDRLAQIEERLAKLEALLERLAPPAANDTKSGGASGSKP